MAEPFQVMAGGCGGYVHHTLTTPSPCNAIPTVVGLLMFRRPDGRRAVWRGFACDAHAHQLLAARPLLPRDSQAASRAQVLTGQGHHPVGRGCSCQRRLTCRVGR
jgi:hypothetical protein